MRTESESPPEDVRHRDVSLKTESRLGGIKKRKKLFVNNLRINGSRKDLLFVLLPSKSLESQNSPLGHLPSPDTSRTNMCLERGL